ncbi:MAG: DUF1592 domain-containing protein [Phycisphaerae bacterium]|nr:DUF1592 domain-containing protein [Tepidisphaeraceae bacterium]
MPTWVSPSSPLIGRQHLPRRVVAHRGTRRHGKRPAHSHQANPDFARNIILGPASTFRDRDGNAGLACRYRCMERTRAMTRLGRTWLGIALLAGTFCAPARAAERPTSLDGVLQSRCMECHDKQTQKGGLDLSALTLADLGDKATFDQWVKVHDRVNAGEMPPAAKAQPPQAERDALIKTLGGILSAADRKRQRESGRVPLRRMNRVEYENTMRDLFSLPGLEIKDRLPADGRVAGFDKVSTALDISAVQMRKYLEAADHVLDSAIVHQDKPTVFRHRFRLIGGLSQFGNDSFPMKEKKVQTDVLRLLHDPEKPGKDLHLKDRGPYLEAMDSLGFIYRPLYDRFVGNFSPLHTGYYRIRTSVWSFNLNRGEVAPGTRTQPFSLVANGRRLGYLDAPSLKPTAYDLVVWLNAGDRPELLPAGLWENRSDPSLFKYVGEAVAVDYVDVEGPLHDVWPPASHRRLFGSLPLAMIPVEKGRATPPVPPPATRHPGSRPNHQDGKEFDKRQPVWTAASPRPKEDAARLLADFLRRAFRRPVPPDEVAVYAKIAHDRIDAGDFFETAMRAAYRVALCSPDFLFLQEPAGTIATDPTILDSYAVASRLSYFLWNSMPDDVLSGLAQKNQLNGKTLMEQVDRMLDDPRSDRFVNDFLDQWLHLRDIDFTSPDGALYPEFRTELRDAMLAESRAYFRELLKNDLGVAHFVDSDFLTINQRLAELYGIPNVVGSAIRRIPKPPDCHRGGFLTQAAVLKVTANGTTTSPVQRGYWVMDRLLGRPPRPPPPDLPAIDPDLNGTTTIREQLARHRANPACAGCHATMDPPGFALESFDVIGGWRTRYRNLGEKGEAPTPSEMLGFPGNGNFEKQIRFRHGLPVDASGQTADGKAFKDVDELRRILLADEESLARNFVERLVLYSTGAPVSFADRAQVEQILKSGRDGRYGVRTLIRGVIRSQLFGRK